MHSGNHTRRVGHVSHAWIYHANNLTDWGFPSSSPFSFPVSSLSLCYSFTYSGIDKIFHLAETFVLPLFNPLYIFPVARGDKSRDQGTWSRDHGWIRGC